MEASSNVEIELGPIPKRRPSLPILRRLQSTESSASSSIGLSTFELNTCSSQRKVRLGSKEFLLKIVQLVIAVVCAGLYSDAKRMMQYSVESMIFPNVVFSAFIIITSVIALGYILGNAVPPILIRIFNVVGMTLYFVTTCITAIDWYYFARFTGKDGDVVSANMLITTACLSLLNVGLYGYDIYLGIKKAFAV